MVHSKCTFVARSLAWVLGARVNDTVLFLWQQASPGRCWPGHLTVSFYSYSSTFVATFLAWVLAGGRTILQRYFCDEILAWVLKGA